MSVQRNEAINFAKNNREFFLKNLVDLASIPSVSTNPSNIPDMQRAAHKLSEHLTSIGMETVRIYPTQGHPIVYGEKLTAPPGNPTMLVYGHYDVQPSDPDELWLTDPFTPTVRGEYLYSRGASDMKGQVIAVLSAIESVMHSEQLPVNIKIMLEGEEEIGSPNLRNFIIEQKTLLASDFALNADAGMLAADLPTIVYRLRGLAYFELRVYGPTQDLHSGLYGGVVHNPAQAICELISGMHDSQGKITLPGFYDSVQKLSDTERAELARLPMDEAYYQKQTGVAQIWGETGYSPTERVGARPTLEINGLSSGFTGTGSKTVIPSYAMAKISMRLVPDQDPRKVHQQLLQYLEIHAPKTIRWELIPMTGSRACISDHEHPATQALAHSLKRVWGTQPVYKPEGGSIPVVVDMQEILGIESVLTGFGLPDDNIHAPNEKLHLPTWYKGIEALTHFFFDLTENNKSE
jgi:acetylornithine deacetylase/succinyl-diaminopimelate desuccinylase-like protein